MMVIAYPLDLQAVDLIKEVNGRKSVLIPLPRRSGICYSAVENLVYQWVLIPLPRRLSSRKSSSPLWLHWGLQDTYIFHL